MEQNKELRNKPFAYKNLVCVDGDITNLWGNHIEILNYCCNNNTASQTIPENQWLGAAIVFFCFLDLCVNWDLLTSSGFIKTWLGSTEFTGLSSRTQVKFRSTSHVSFWQLQKLKRKSQVTKTHWIPLLPSHILTFHWPNKSHGQVQHQ